MTTPSVILFIALHSKSPPQQMKAILSHINTAVLAVGHSIRSKNKPKRKALNVSIDEGVSTSTGGSLAVIEDMLWELRRGSRPVADCFINTRNLCHIFPSTGLEF